MAHPVSDVQLASASMEVRNEGRVLLIARRALARENLALMKANECPHRDVHCLPALSLTTPVKITPGVKSYIEKHRGDFSDINGADADCGTGGQLQSRPVEMGVSLIAGPHCHSLFEGTADYEAREELTCFYLSDFLERQFDALY